MADLSDGVKRLRVEKTSPTDKDRLIDPDTTIEVYFTDNIDRETLNKSTFALFQGNLPIPGEINYKPTEKKATFVPSNSLNPDTQYRVSLSSTIQSVGDDPLKNYSFIFRTHEADHKFSAPHIINPAIGESLNRPVIQWGGLNKANRYDIEIAKDPSFNSLEYSAMVKEKTEITPKLEKGNEYFVRVRAHNVVLDEVNKKEVFYTYDRLNKIDANKFEIQINRDHTPVESIYPYSTSPHEIGAKIYKQRCYGSREAINEIPMTNRGKEKITEDDTVSDSQIYIKDQEKGIIRIYYSIKEDELVEFTFKHPKIINRSGWSNIVNFYYEDDMLDFEGLIDAKHSETGLQGQSFELLDSDIQVDSDKEDITFRVYQTDIEVENINIRLESEDIITGEISTVDDLDIEIINETDTYTDLKIFKYDEEDDTE